MKHTPFSTGMPERMGCVVFNVSSTKYKCLKIW